ncbi:hypothetical protein COJ85_29605 [Bacillus sp. AFS076308]|uniref:CDP-glycerol glycerophosphotransferase family protein n=1 Tax=Bacillus sp. AFS076308 TaxID=2033512 RepID=UPI000BFA8EA1|nr:CDP-glycerol glycerophosphotransferase family protein [Bacillus sp. AFS076308]PFN80578.1 hypothetical protein COJ85_29605 [Bacillus sp. AFS076308]
MKSLKLLDLDFQNGALIGILAKNNIQFTDKTLTFVLTSKELNSEKRFLAHILKTTNQQIHFKLPFHFIDFPIPKDHIGTFGIYVTLANNQKYNLVIRSKPLFNKIIYSHFSFQTKNKQQMAFFTLKGQNLALDYGDTTYLLRNMKREKTIISDLSYNESQKSLSFSIKGAHKQHKRQVVMVERGSKTEWLEEFQSSDSELVYIDLSRFSRAYYNQPSRWDFFLETMNHLGEIKRSKLGVYDKKAALKNERYFQSSSTPGINVITPYLTDLNSLSLVISEPHHIANERLNSNIKILTFTMKHNIINGKVYVQLPDVDTFLVESLVLKYRSKTDHMEFEFPILEEKRSQTDCFVTFSVDVANLKLQNFYWDFYLLVNVKGDDCLIRLRNPVGKVRRLVNKKSEKQSYTYENGYWVHPYITAANTIALLYKVKEEYETSWFYLKEKLAYLLYLSFKWYFDQKNIWLGFEKFADSAQDNGYYFFQYCYQQDKHCNFYYVIKKDSPDYDNLQAMSDKVIDYMSFKYMVYLFAASLLISSESKGHVYDIRVQKGLLKKALERKRQVFLQHGVIGLKRVDQIFRKTSKSAVDLFVVSSEHEKEIIKNNFGYKEEEIIITGLSRWDVLTDRSNGQSTILLMPTWRSWMDDLPEDKFVNTEYYRQYASLLNSDVLEKLLAQYDIQLKFFIHPKFKAYIDKFSSYQPRIHIYEFGDIQLNELLMQSSLLITDYSSVSWDMYYQKKPIIFYQFDLDDYMKYQGSYIDMTNDLFGDRAQEVDQLLTLIRKYAKRNFQEEAKYASMRTNYLKYTDRQNSHRIFQEILNHKQQLKKKKRGLAYYESSLLRSLWAYAKKNERSFKIADYIKRKLIKT